MKCEAGKFSNVKASSSVIYDRNFSAEGTYRCETCPDGKTSIVTGPGVNPDSNICENGSYARNTFKSEQPKLSNEQFQYLCAAREHNTVIEQLELRNLVPLVFRCMQIAAYLENAVII